MDSDRTGDRGLPAFLAFDIDEGALRMQREMARLRVALDALTGPSPWPGDRRDAAAEPVRRWPEAAMGAR
jgi:hypothetical protein